MLQSAQRKAWVNLVTCRTISQKLNNKSSCASLMSTEIEERRRHFPRIVEFHPPVKQWQLETERLASCIPGIRHQDRSYREPSIRRLIERSRAKAATNTHSHRSHSHKAFRVAAQSPLHKNQASPTMQQIRDFLLVHRISLPMRACCLSSVQYSDPNPT